MRYVHLDVIPMDLLIVLFSILDFFRFLDVAVLLCFGRVYLTAEWKTPFRCHYETKLLMFRVLMVKISLLHFSNRLSQVSGCGTLL